MKKDVLKLKKINKFKKIGKKCCKRKQKALVKYPKKTIKTNNTNFQKTVIKIFPRC